VADTQPNEPEGIDPSAASAPRPIDDLPVYVPIEPAPTRPVVKRVTARRTMLAGAVVLAAAGCIGVVVGVLFAPPARATVGARQIIEFAWLPVLLVLATLLGQRAWEPTDRVCRGPMSWSRAERGLVRPLLGSPLNGLLLVTTVGVGLAAGMTAPAGIVPLVLGVSSGLAASSGLQLWRLVRAERATGWWSLQLRMRRGLNLDMQTYAGDGLVLDELDVILTLPAPLAELDLGAMDPHSRWHILQALHRYADALAVAEAAYEVSDPTFAGWAGLSALALGRPDDAERWIQRSVDDGYRGGIDPAVRRAFAPLHGTPAWQALLRQTH
jgi:hypothetical protein